jgi:flagellar basal body-associated protein FliL
MKHSKKLIYVLLSIVSILLSTMTWASPVMASNQAVVTSGNEKEKIKEIIQTYFDLRYRTLNTLQRLWCINPKIDTSHPSVESS